MDLETTLETLAPGLLRYCLGLTGEPSMAEEVSQDALTALVDRWRRHGPPDSAEAFVFTVARRRAKRARWKKRLFLPLDALSRNDEPTANLEGELAQRRELEQTLRAIGKLPAKNREALLLVVAGEVETATAARILGVSLSAAKMRVHRARKQLIDSLEVSHEIC